MKLSKLDKSVLNYIWKTYDIVFDPSIENVAVGEMPLASRDSISNHFNSLRFDPNQVDASVKTLLSYQLINRKYLLNPALITEQATGSRIIRLVSLPRCKSEQPQEHLQVTAQGKEKLDQFPENRLVKFCADTLERFAAPIAANILTLIAGAILGYFGNEWMIRPVSVGANAPKAPLQGRSTYDQFSSSLSNTSGTPSK